MSRVPGKDKVAGEKDQVIQHRHHKNREILIGAIVFLGVAGLSVLLGLLGSFHVITDEYSVTAYLFAGLSGFAGALMLWGYFVMETDIRTSAANPNFETTEGYQKLRSGWQYETQTPLSKQWKDVFSVVLIVFGGLLIFPGAWVALQWLIKAVWPQSPVLLRMVVAGGVSWFLMSRFIGFLAGPKLRGTARGVRVLTSGFTAPGNVITQARGHRKDSPLWLVIEPPGRFQEGADTTGQEQQFKPANHVIIMTPLDDEPSPPFTLSVETVVKLIAHPDIRHIGPLNDVTIYLAAHVQPGDVVLVMSAGDATRIGSDLLSRLSQ